MFSSVFGIWSFGLTAPRANLFTLRHDQSAVAAVLSAAWHHRARRGAHLGTRRFVRL